MNLEHTTATFVALLIGGGAIAADSPYQWTYLRPGNTGVMGDASDALWVAPDGTLYLGGYVPSFEEGGFSRYIAEEDRWENFSNVDHPVIGDPLNTGSVRISDFCPDADGRLWMGTWRGALFFDPAVGPESIVRYDGDNSPIPGGRTMDVDIAPDGSVWFGCHGNGGGLARFEPASESWTVWGFDQTADGWPGWVTLHATVVQPKPGGGYFVWIDDSFGRCRFDSDTQSFTVLPNQNTVGEIRSVLANGDDDAGNVWMLRSRGPGQLYALEYLTPDGTWVAPPMPFAGATEVSTFRAFGDGEALMIGAGSEAFVFDGDTWSSLGEWRPGGGTNGIGMAPDGGVWVSGSGGAARRDPATGVWQRHRLSNTGLLDYWVRDIAFAPDGDVWMTSNGAAGVGGMVRFDGQRWHNHNIATYGLGEEWPYPTDNVDAIAWRASSGRVVFNPMNNGIREWDGLNYSTLEASGKSDGLVEDSNGRLWTMGNYFNLRYHDAAGFHDVPIAGWGSNVVEDPDRPGTIWGCANLEVVRTDGRYRFSRENVDLPELDPLHDVLTTVVADHAGIAWLGSTEGLFRLDAETGTHQWWHASNSAIPADQVTPLTVSPDGRVWFTNFNSVGFEPALVWFDGESFGTITRGEGLPHEQIVDAEVRSVSGGYEIWLACASRGIAILTVEIGPSADLNDDGLVDPADLALLLAAWGPCGKQPNGCPADLDGDGFVGGADLAILLNAWGPA